MWEVDLGCRRTLGKQLCLPAALRRISAVCCLDANESEAPRSDHRSDKSRNFIRASVLKVSLCLKRRGLAAGTYRIPGEARNPGTQEPRNPGGGAPPSC